MRTHGERVPDGDRAPAPPLGAPVAAPRSVEAVLALQQGAGNALVARFLDVERPQREDREPPQSFQVPHELPELEHPDESGEERRRSHARRQLMLGRVVYERAATQLLIAGQLVLGQLVPELARAEHDPHGTDESIAAAKAAVTAHLAPAGGQLMSAHASRLSARAAADLPPAALATTAALDEIALRTALSAVGEWLIRVQAAGPGGQHSAAVVGAQITAAHADLSMHTAFAAPGED